jgi:DNA mismatch repair protein MutS2
MVTREHSLTRLDFFRLRERLEGYCLSYEGQALMRSTLPCARPESVKKLKQDLAALAEGLNNKEVPSFPFPDIAALVPKAQKEGMLLEVDELFALGMWVKSYEQLFAFLRSMLHTSQSQPQISEARARKRAGKGRARDSSSGNDGGDSDWFLGECETSEDDERWALPGIERIVFSAPSLLPIREKIFAVVTLEGEMKELPRTRSLRIAIQRAQAENHRLVNQYLSDPNLQDALQSNAATERDNRTVIAVKANFKGRLKGIVHEFSSTGQTVFVEPIELVERNNHLLELETRLGEEIRAILRETADALRPLLPLLVEGRRFLAAADIRLARAIQLKREDLAIAEVLESGVHLYQAKHPLLGKKAVPIDVDIPDGTNVLIITGPNTGGKTVSLKTIGLLALLNQYGAGIPALPTSGFTVFDTVCADIGDEQSIDQSLSTFSGHMRVISGIAASATERSLVLLDELGAGTDPEEGCAIAMALLDYFLERGCMTIVTTHHGVLKNYGYTKQGCLNASMEFNAQSLSPTYRISMGVPGESRALEIAKQTGLSSDIVDTAKSYLDDERSDYSALIRSLGEKQRELELLERERRKQLQGALESRRKADLENLKVRQKELELRRQGVAELVRFLSESRKTFENLVREMRESGQKVEEASSGRELLKEMSDEMQRRSDELSQFEEETDALERSMRIGRDGVQSIDVAMLKPGEKVFFQNREAVFLRALDDKKVLVQVGALRIPVTVDALSIPRAEKGKATETRPSYQIELSGATNGGARASAELDLRGMRLAEALDVLSRQIDAASLTGLGTFSVIHGTGEGILAKGIHDWLKTKAAVADYYFARPEDGGFGKTWIHLKT